MNASNTRRGFVAGLMRGFGAAGEIYGQRVKVKRARSSVEALRSDWERVGSDVRTAATRADAETARKSP